MGADFDSSGRIFSVALLVPVCNCSRLPILGRSGTAYGLRPVLATLPIIRIITGSVGHTAGDFNGNDMQLTTDEQEFITFPVSACSLH
jgi:hypothetical protein